MHMFRVIAPLACLLLAACGQKGNLYLPEDRESTVVPVQPAMAPAPAASPAPAATPAAGVTTEETEEQRRQRQQAAPANNGNN
jgi:predicted small lipoprotein YifL